MNEGISPHFLPNLFLSMVKRCPVSITESLVNPPIPFLIKTQTGNSLVSSAS